MAILYVTARNTSRDLGPSSPPNLISSSRGAARKKGGGRGRGDGRGEGEEGGGDAGGGFGGRKGISGGGHSSKRWPNDLKRLIK